MIAGGRHPVIEKLLEQRGERFVPNDLYLDDESQFLLIITGPNMGGKSTYLRQAALISILAQAGSFVPAAQAKLRCSIGFSRASARRIIWRAGGRLFWWK